MYQLTADIKFTELCEEIDYWKLRALKAELTAKEWQDKYSQQSNEMLQNAQKGVANALMFALHCSDDEKGNLVIKKEDRKKLAKTFKK